MTRTEGEHELVLGNKQLLSAFFVVVILLGVFFTMGYFVGKNTATAGFNAGQSPSGGTRPDAAGKPLDDGGSASSTPPESTSPVVDPSVSAPSAALPLDAKPDLRSDAKVNEKSDFPLESAPSKSDSSRSEAKPETAKKETMVESTSEQLYLQVSAIRRPDADNLVKVLRERGFHALLGESSKQGLYRVLVGPFKTNGEMGRAKSELRSKGFESIVAK